MAREARREQGLYNRSNARVLVPFSSADIDVLPEFSA